MRRAPHLVPLAPHLNYIVTYSTVWWRRGGRAPLEVIVHKYDNHFAMVGFKLNNFVRLQGLSNEAHNGKLARIDCLLADVHTGEFRVEIQEDEELQLRLILAEGSWSSLRTWCALAIAATLLAQPRCSIAVDVGMRHIATQSVSVEIGSGTKSLAAV